MTGRPGILGVPDGVAMAGCLVLDELRRAPMTKRELAEAAEVSPTTVHRALDWLRGLGAPVTFDRLARVWVLEYDWTAPTWRLGRHGLYLVVTEDECTASPRPTAQLLV